MKGLYNYMCICMKVLHVALSIMMSHVLFHYIHQFSSGAEVSTVGSMQWYIYIYSSFIPTASCRDINGTKVAQYS